MALITDTGISFLVLKVSRIILNSCLKKSVVFKLLYGLLQQHNEIVRHFYSDEPTYYKQTANKNKFTLYASEC